MKEMPTRVADKFKNKWANPDFDVEHVLAAHLHHSYYEFVNGEKVVHHDRPVYNITEKCAKYLIHNLKHGLPRDADFAQRLFSYSNDLYNKGNVDFPKHPIVINKSSNTIEKGVLRLFGLAVSRCRGTFFEIKLVDNEDK